MDNAQQKADVAAVGMLSPFELKDKLREIADESTRSRATVMLNAGRGNPNWIATVPREGFFLLGAFALQEARRTRDESDAGLAGMPSSIGIAKRFRAYLDGSPKSPGIDLLRGTLDYGVEKLGFKEDAFVWEMAD